jgi:hypothetical protein
MPPAVFNPTREDSSSRRDPEPSKGSTPPFSDSLVRISRREQTYPEGVTTGSVSGVRPVRAQMKDWTAFDWAMVYVSEKMRGDRGRYDVAVLLEFWRDQS